MFHPIHEDKGFVSDFGGIGDLSESTSHGSGPEASSTHAVPSVHAVDSSHAPATAPTAIGAATNAKTSTIGNTAETIIDIDGTPVSTAPLDPDKRIGMPGGTPVEEAIVREEWQQFQGVNNEGDRAACQGNWPTFHQMRLSQFLTWPHDAKISYLADLQQAAQQGRNLLTEKYARMMQSTDPDYYRTNLEPYLPTLSTARIEQQERIIATQVAWAQDFANCYPRLGAAMRTLRTSDDTKDSTSFETYLRGELSTYSQRTLDLYDLMVRDYAQAGENITALTVRNTVLLGGFVSLDEAEEAQA